LFESRANIEPIAYLMLMTGAVGDWISTRIGLSIGLFDEFRLLGPNGFHFGSPLHSFAVPGEQAVPVEGLKVPAGLPVMRWIGQTGRCCMEY